MRKLLKTALVVLVSVVMFGSLAEAAPKKVVKHRVRHTSRVSASAPASSGAKKRTAHKHHKHKRTSVAARTTTKPR